MNTENIIGALEKIGLSKKESQIYLSSLSIGQTTASVLGQRSKIARSTAQYICNGLVEKRLLNIIAKGNSFLYSPEPPEKIISMLNKEYTSIEKKMNSAQQIMGNLNNIATPHIKLASIKYYSGVDGIIEMFQDVLNTKSDIYGFLQISKDVNKEIFEYLNTTYSRKRSALGLKSYSIFNISDMAKEVYEKSKSVNREVLLIDPDIYPIESCIQVYGNKVAFYSYKNNDLTGVIIDNKNIADTHKSLFKGMWNLAKNLEPNI